jgi:tetratricopeptide (TPR) repeat protein
MPPKTSRLYAAIVALMSAYAPSAQAADAVTTQNLHWCRGEDGADAAKSLEACTTLIPLAQDPTARGGTYDYRGQAYAKLGNHAAAIEDFTQAIQLIPNQPELTPFLYLERGIEYAQIGQNDNAIADIRMTISLRPPNNDIIEAAQEWLQKLGATP